MFRRKDEDSATDTDNQGTSGDSYLADANRNTAGAGAAAPASNATMTASSPAAAAPAQPYAAPPQRTMPGAMPDASKLSPGAGYRPTMGPTSSAGGSRPADRSSALSGDKTKSNRSVLTVGHGIELKGEIATCDRLVIEGQVDATLNNVHTMEIAEGGSFKGAAKIEEAEISGLFDGDLEVRGRLIIYSTGRVRGKITYGEIEIERGGELTGEIKLGGSKGAAYDKSDKKANAA